MGLAQRDPIEQHLLFERLKCQKLFLVCFLQEEIDSQQPMVLISKLMTILQGQVDPENPVRTGSGDSAEALPEDIVAYSGVSLLIEQKL